MGEPGISIILVSLCFIGLAFLVAAIACAIVYVAGDQTQMTIREDILDAAREAVTGRPEYYGEPEDSFDRVALVYRAIFPEREWTASDVTLALAALKLVRLSFHPEHRDSAVDIAGYAACQAECAAKDVK